MTPGAAPGASPKLTVRRAPEKGRTDPDLRDAILDAGLVVHLGFADHGWPYVIPVGYARDGDRLLVHGSSASRAMKQLGTGIPACATVTLLDGLVVARSQFESSMHYRCVSIFGAFEMLQGEVKIAALEVLGARLIPATGARPTLPQEARATAVLALPLTQFSVKVSDRDPEDAAIDAEVALWAGVIPLHHSWGEPVTAPDLPDGAIRPDPAISAWTAQNLR